MIRRALAALAVTAAVLTQSGVAMAAPNSTPIPLTTLSTNQTTITPTVPVAGATSATITLNRTGTGNHPWLNTLTSATTLIYTIQTADSTGVWVDEAITDDTGGVFQDKHGVTITQEFLSVTGINPAAVSARAKIQVSGPSPVTLSGSMSTQ